MAKMMFPGKLSQAAVKAAKPKEKSWKLSDGGGLYLFISPAGTKYWRLKYRYDKKEKTLSLGQYPYFTLSEARENALEAKKQIAKGFDPSQIKKQKELENRTRLFENIADEWFTKRKGSWTPKHIHKVKRSLEKDTYPFIGKTLISEIETHNIIEVIDKIQERDALDIAKRTKQRISSIFRYAMSKGLCKYNPVDGIGDDIIKSRRVKHRLAITDRQLPDFLKALDGYGGRVETILAMKLLILTFVRPGELRNAYWNEFDFESKLWRIPAERMKMDEEHLIPLSSQSIEVLRQLQPITGSCDLLFPSTTNLTKPISINTLAKVIKNLGFNATAHGFRTTASTILNETGFRVDIIEKQLSHSERNAVRNAYNRAQYLKDRHEMMQWWGDYIDRMRNKENVVNGKFGIIC